MYIMCDYAYVLNYIKKLKLTAPQFVKVRTAGKSVFGRDIPAVIVGTGKPRVLIFGAIHAREHITASLALELANEYLDRIISYGILGESIIFVPMVNPDGVELSIHGISSAPQTAREFLLNVNGSEDFSLWKANGNAVDLNVNFNADWGKGVQNVRAPSSANYIGKRPMSEPETRAIASLATDTDFAISYHAKGETVYYGYYHGAHAEDGFEAGKRLASALNYTLEKSLGSAGGFKDWYLLTNRGLAFTIEVGKDEWQHPLSEVYLPNLTEKHRIVPKLAVELEKQYGRKIHEARN